MSSGDHYDDMFNGSVVNDDIFTEIGNENQRYEIPPWVFTIIMDLLKLLAGALALASDIYLIVIIRKFQTLKNTINSYILQYAIYNIFYLLLGNILMIIMDLLLHLYTVFELFIFISNLDHLILNLSFNVLSLMSVEWYISNYHPKVYERYQKWFSRRSVILVLASVPPWVVTSIICFLEHNLYTVQPLMEELCFIFSAFFIVTVVILTKIKAPPSEAYKTEYALNVSKIVFLMSTLLYCSRLYEIFTEYYSDIYYLIYYVGEIIFLAAPIFVVYYLTRTNKYFRSAYIKSFKKRRVQNYEDNNLDEDSCTDVIANNIIFKKDSETVNL